MSDPTNPATPEGNTANPPTIDWESPDNPYAQRYRDAQSHLTPLQQENARLKALEEDPAAYLEVGKTKGWIEIDDPSAGGAQEQDPYADRWARLEAIEARQQADEAAKQERDNQTQVEQALASINTDLDKWAKDAGVTLDEYGRAGIITRFSQDPAAGENDEATLKRHFDAYAGSLPKAPRPRIPTPPGGGGGGAAHTGAPVWSEMTEAEQNEYMAARVAGRI